MYEYSVKAKKCKGENINQRLLNEGLVAVYDQLEETMNNKSMKIVWIAAVATNVALAVVNASTGNTGWGAFNALCAVACQYGYIQLKNHE